MNTVEATSPSAAAAIAASPPTMATGPSATPGRPPPRRRRRPPRAFVEAARPRHPRPARPHQQPGPRQHEYVGPHPDWFRTACVCGLSPAAAGARRPLDCLFAPYLPDINWRVAGAEQQFISDAIWWIETFGVDGFRVDAVKHVETCLHRLRDAVAAASSRAAPAS
ncbi:MAG: alpha-amylase family glycosyl hydrolase [bacterium]